MLSLSLFLSLSLSSVFLCLFICVVVFCFVWVFDPCCTSLCTTYACVRYSQWQALQALLCLFMGIFAGCCLPSTGFSSTASPSQSAQTLVHNSPWFGTEVGGLWQAYHADAHHRGELGSVAASTNTPITMRMRMVRDGSVQVARHTRRAGI